MTTAQNFGRVPAIDLPVRLLIARSAAGMSQSDLAKAIGAGRATIANYEAGKAVKRSTVMASGLGGGDAARPAGDVPRVLVVGTRRRARVH